MKITVELADDLASRARAHAAKEGTTLRALVERGLRHVLAADEKAGRFQLRNACVGGHGLNEAFQGASWHRIRAAAYESGGG